MISASLKKDIEKTIAMFPERGSALLPVLDMVQRANDNRLNNDDILNVSNLIGIPPSKAYGVVTYYSMFNTGKVGKYHIQVDTNIPATLMGAGDIVSFLEKKLKIKCGQTTPDGKFTLDTVEDLGSCGTCPVIQVNDVYYENQTVESADKLIESLKKDIMPDPSTVSYWGSECGILLKNRADTSCRSIEVYRKKGGYSALQKALKMEPSEIVTLVKASMLRGRGGAGFPTGTKWSFLPQNRQGPVYLICNADEGEPGTFKDRQIMEYDPHLLIEGIAIAAHAIGAGKAFIYIRGEFRRISEILDKAISEARSAGMLDKCDIMVYRGQGSYVCGEETALIESLEGKRGCPRIKPPFPVNKGLYGCSTIVNNVETLACLPFIVEHGADEFKKIGTIGNSGSKLFGVSGHVNKPGVYEFPLGTPLKRILEAAGGVKGSLKAVIVGGLSTPILTADEAENLYMDYDCCLKAGTMLGSGGIIVMNDTVSIPPIALRTIKFYAHESCGQCTPCREGSVAIENLLHGLVEGYGSSEDIDKILKICNTVMGLTLCPTGDAFAMPIRAMVKKFRHEFEALVR